MFPAIGGQARQTFYKAPSSEPKTLNIKPKAISTHQLNVSREALRVIFETNGDTRPHGSRSQAAADVSRETSAHKCRRPVFPRVIKIKEFHLGR